MYNVYVLKSVQTGRKYIGHCFNIKKRLDEHNSGKVRSTKPYRPYSVIYIEEKRTKEEEIKREKFLKTLSGRKELYKIIKPEMAELVDLPGNNL